MNLSLSASLSETEREEQRKITVLAPLSVSERGWGRGQKRSCRTHVNIGLTHTLRFFSTKRYALVQADYRSGGLIQLKSHNT
jgi:hypothetical protein